MPCFCNPVIVPPANPCQGCLQVNDMLVGCDTGPLPCGTTTVIDLAANNDLTVCTGIPVWSIRSFDPLAFTNVSITQSGIISFDTTNYFKKGKDFIITYEVDCPNSLLRADGDIKVCFKDPCSAICPDCNPCTSNCIQANDGNTTATRTGAGCPNIINVFDLKTISTYSDCGLNIVYKLVYPTTVFGSISEVAGLLNFTILPAAISGATYDIVYTMECLDLKIAKTGTLHVTINSLCDGVVCLPNFVCDECTGLCVPIPPEISIGNLTHEIGIS